MAKNSRNTKNTETAASRATREELDSNAAVADELMWTPDDLRLIRILRAHGVSPTELFRQLLREEAARLEMGPIDADEVLSEVFQRCPDPPDWKQPAPPDTTDRDELSALIRARVRSKTVGAARSKRAHSKTAAKTSRKASKRKRR